MSCTRCQEPAVNAAGWCASCEGAYDTWVRRYATDVLGPVFVGMVIVSTLGLGLPLLGAGYLAGTIGVFAGFGSLIGLHRRNRRRRRRQFALGELPRAYLPAKT